MKTRPKNYDRRIPQDGGPDSLRSGRCFSCRLLYRWRPGKRRQLGRAFCVRCEGPLCQTTATNLKRVPHIPDCDPIFAPSWEVTYRADGAESKLTYTKLGLTKEKVLGWLTQGGTREVALLSVTER